MSSFYDDASLVVIPSGYKTSKVYAEKPTDGSGDLTFTRTGDTATRVNSAGLIEKVRINRVLQSQDQSNSAYSSVINQITSRTAVANPLTGSSNAYKILSAGGTDPYIGQVVNGLSNGENTFSLWLWTDSGQNVNCDLIFYNATASEIYTKSITITTTPTRYDHTVNFTSVGANATVRLDLCQSCGVTYVYTYGWQVESGVATAYIPTTTAAVSVGPTANTARLDYLGSTCPRLILEPQRQNALLQSETLNSATWTKDGGSVTANAVASPDGYTNADLFTEDTSTGNHRVYQNPISTSANQPVTFSVFAKYNGRQYVYLRTDLVSPKTAVFDIQNGTAGTVSSGASSKIENYGNGWYRLILTVDALAGNAAVCEGLIGFLSGSSFSNASYTGNGTAGVYLWGFQGEANAAYATSYIPTLAASATRGADACSKTGISSLIGQTEGTLFIEFKFDYSDSTTQVLFKANQTTDANSVGIEVQGTTIKGLVNSGGGNIANITGTIATGTIKAALAYKTNDMAFYVNGTQVGVDTSGSIAFAGVVDILTIGQFLLNGGTFFPASRPFNQALLFKTRLTNAELAELTTL